MSESIFVNKWNEFSVIWGDFFRGVEDIRRTSISPYEATNSIFELFTYTVDKLNNQSITCDLQMRVEIIKTVRKVMSGESID